MKKGTIHTWKDDKGFGFIETDTGESLFFHISDYEPPKRPETGEQVMFTVTQNSKGKPQASTIQSVAFFERQQKRIEQQLRQDAFEQGQLRKLVFAIIFYGLLFTLSVLAILPWFVFGLYVFLGVFTFAMYAKDKHAANHNKWRTPENTLHILAILGGWVGALVAQTYLRHKSQKTSFRRIYYLTVFLNFLLLAMFIFYKMN